MERKIFTKKDIIVIAALLLVALLLAIPSLAASSSDLTATVTVNGEVFCEIDLSAVDESYEIELLDGSVVLLVEKNSICFKASDCDNETCVKTGALDYAGAAAVCVPNGVIVAVSGDKGVDAVAY